MILLQIIYFIIGKISTKYNIHKLKKIIDLEFIVVEKIIVKLNKLMPFYLDFYKDMIENEIKYANISKQDKILHIGSGSIPATSILIVEKTNANVTGIDHNLNSVNKSKKIISEYNYSDKIKIIHIDALDFQYNKYNIIIFSQGVKPVDKILKKIAEKMKNDTSLIFRTTSRRNGKITENDRFIEDIFSVKKIIHQEKNGLLVSIILNKK